jgi:hypothetical protein
VLEREDERGEEKGQWATPFNDARGRRGGSRAGIRVEEGEEWREGSAGTAVGTGPWTTGTGVRRAQDAAPIRGGGLLTCGYGATVTGGSV